MSHIRQLNPYESRDLHLWLERQRIDLNAKKRRKLSDVLPVATIAQRVYPRLVDLIHYTPSRHSVANKLQNWKVFNFTVLKKLHINLSESYMKELAQGQVGAIEESQIKSKPLSDLDLDPRRPKNEYFQFLATPTYIS